MLLALDIGNTEITVGLFRGDPVSAQWRLATNPDRTRSAWGTALGSFLLHSRRAAERFGVDQGEILLELGRRKVVGGQEDMIIDVALQLSVKGS